MRSDPRIDKARNVPLQTVLAKCNVELARTGGELVGPCPLCHGHDRFSISLRKQVFNCRGCGRHGGGAIDLTMFIKGVDFGEAVTLLTGQAPPEKKEPPNGKAHDEGASVLVGEWNYEDENGELLFQVQRLNRSNADGSPMIDDYGKRKKKFLQRHRDRTGQWIWNIVGVRRVLYRLPELIEDLAHDREIILVEGEGKVNLLRDQWNIPATCNAMGAGKWLDEYSATFRGASVVILPDNDGPGRKHIGKVATSLVAAGATVRILDLPGLGPKQDVADWAAAGGTIEQLHALIERESRPWTPEVDTTAPSTRKVKRGGDFLAEYVPITYAIDGVLPSGCIYTLTGKTGSGKTTLAQPIALSVISGRNLIGFDVEPGRVADVVLEVAPDFRMKLAIAAYVHGVHHKELNDKLTILDMHLPHAEIIDQLKRDGEENGPFRLVFYDTFQAGFAGAEFNDNAEVLKHAQQLRELTILRGNPAAIVPSHPIKNATRDNLLPYGGGSTINEVDGNLTLWADDGRIEFGWTKVRGREPEPRFFRIEKLGSPDILDSKGARRFYR